MALQKEKTIILPLGGGRGTPLIGHKLSLVYFCYGSVVDLYCTNDVLMNYERVQTNYAVRVSQYSHGKNPIDLQQFADVFGAYSPSCLKPEKKLIWHHLVFKLTTLYSRAPVTVILIILFDDENSIFTVYIMLFGFDYN